MVPSMTAPGSSAPSVGTKWSAALIAGLLAVAAALLFYAIYVALPQQHHYWALIAIGILALLFAFGSYLAESLSRAPVAQRSFAWGFFAMGFAVLIVSIALGTTYSVLTLFGELIALVVVILALVVAVALIAWRTRALQATQERLRKREAWQNAPTTSALDYAAAHTPSVPQVPTAPAPNSPPPRSP